MPDKLSNFDKLFRKRMEENIRQERGTQKRRGASALIDAVTALRGARSGGRGRTTTGAAGLPGMQDLDLREFTGDIAAERNSILGIDEDKGAEFSRLENEPWALWNELNPTVRSMFGEEESKALPSGGMTREGWEGLSSGKKTGLKNLMQQTASRMAGQRVRNRYKEARQFLAPPAAMAGGETTGRGRTTGELMRALAPIFGVEMPEQAPAPEPEEETPGYGVITDPDTGEQWTLMEPAGGGRAEIKKWGGKKKSAPWHKKGLKEGELHKLAIREMRKHRGTPIKKWGRTEAGAGKTGGGQKAGKQSFITEEGERYEKNLETGEFEKTGTKTRRTKTRPSPWELFKSQAKGLVGERQQRGPLGQTSPFLGTRKTTKKKTQKKKKNTKQNRRNRTSSSTLTKLPGRRNSRRRIINLPMTGQYTGDSLREMSKKLGGR